jgi:hypothetical protein
MTWGELYALFCVETGWTWEYVDEEMTLPRADEFVKLWKITPPLRLVLASIAVALGMPAPDAKPKLKPGDPRPPGKDLGSYLEAFGSAGIQAERVKKNG